MSCIYYDPDNGYCKLHSDWHGSMPIIEYCVEGPCPDEKFFTQFDRLRAMSDEELVKLSVYCTTAPFYDEGIDGYMMECGDEETWHSVFTDQLYASEEDAIEYVLEWGRSPYKEDGNG